MASRRVWVVWREVDRHQPSRGLGLRPCQKADVNASEHGGNYWHPAAIDFGSSRATAINLMPPRPRPKPKVRAGNNPQPLKETLLSQDEEDSIFIKSNNLTTATWKQMNQIPSGELPLLSQTVPLQCPTAHASLEGYTSVDARDLPQTSSNLTSKRYPLSSSVTISSCLSLS